MCGITPGFMIYRQLFFGKAAFSAPASLASKTRAGWHGLSSPAVLGRPISIYGDGKQIRDLLFVEDLLDAYDAAIARKDKQLLEKVSISGVDQRMLSPSGKNSHPILEKLLGHPIQVKWGDWRPGDQKVFVSDIRKAKQELGWEPKVGVEEGIRRLYRLGGCE